jgi:hypothetical protein
MDLTKLATLKEKLVSAKEFAEVWTYFLDHLGENPEFMALGERVQDRFLERVLSEIGKQLFGRTVQVRDTAFIHLPEHGFVHGALTLEDRPGSVFYFRDIRQGLVVLVWSLAPTETKFARFSGFPMPSPWNRSAN